MIRGSYIADNEKKQQLFFSCFFLSDDAQDEIRERDKETMKYRLCGHQFLGEFWKHTADLSFQSNYYMAKGWEWIFECLERCPMQYPCKIQETAEIMRSTHAEVK